MIKSMREKASPNENEDPELPQPADIRAMITKIVIFKVIEPCSKNKKNAYLKLSARVYSKS